MEEKQIHIHPRRLARQMAKRDLDYRGATGYNKTPKGLGKGARMSLFAQHWKEFAIEAMRPRNKKSKHN